MSFLDPDPVEQLMGKNVQDCTDTELVTYIKTYLSGVYDIKLPVIPHRERAIMAALMRTYGSDAGLLVKWALLHHGPVRYDDFNKGRKWLTDGWYVEMQQYLKRQQANAAVTERFSRLEDL